MEKEKNRIQLHRKSLNFFIGVFISLLMICLIINIGVPARILTYPFVFAFGAAAYFLFAFIYIEGFCLFVFNRTILLKKFYKVVGLIITFFGIMVLLCSIADVNMKASGENSFITLFKESDYIFNKEYIQLFADKYGGGYLGYLLTETFMKVHVSIPFIVSSLLLVFGLGLIFADKIYAFSKNRRVVTREKLLKKDKIRGSEFEEPEPLNKEKKPVSLGRINNIDVISSASKIDNQAQNSNFNSNNRMINNPYFSNQGYAGTFIKAHFNREMNAPEANKEATFVRETREREINKPTPTLVKEEKIINEQLKLDFDKAPEINQELLTAKPEFAETVVTNRVEERTVKTTAGTPQKKIKWVAPSSELLDVTENKESINKNIAVAEERKEAINAILANFGVGAHVVSYIIGPSVTRYNVDYEPNVNARSVSNLVQDISIRLKGQLVRFEPVVQGSPYSGIEIPNAVVTTVNFKDLYQALAEEKRKPLLIAFGKNIQGEVITGDFAKFPHLLVAGTTGSGKSVFINSLITTLIMRNSPELLRLILVDPKKVEMVKYRDMPHLLCPIINDSKQAKPMLDKLVEEMNDRYTKFELADGCTSIEEYNEYAEEAGLNKIPYIVCIIDEYGDLVQTNKEVATPIVLLGQKARASGIHILIATQSPTSDVITGTIRNNLPAHVALATANTQQSVSIIGEGGGEKLLGYGDMLVQSAVVSRSGLVRLQGCLITKKEINRVVGYLKDHYETVYNDKFMHLDEVATIEGNNLVRNGMGGMASSDPVEENRYQDIKKWVMSQQYISMSRIQGECSVGFNRARRFFTRLQEEGVVAREAEGNKGCPVLLSDSLYDNNDSLPTSDEQTSFGD